MILFYRISNAELIASLCAQVLECCSLGKADNCLKENLKCEYAQFVARDNSWARMGLFALMLVTFCLPVFAFDYSIGLDFGSVQTAQLSFQEFWKKAGAGVLSFGSFYISNLKLFFSGIITPGLLRLASALSSLATSEASVEKAFSALSRRSKITPGTHCKKN